jgi:hypothetical protein
MVSPSPEHVRDRGVARGAKRGEIVGGLGAERIAVAAVMHLQLLGGVAGPASMAVAGEGFRAQRRPPG